MQKLWVELLMWDLFPVISELMSYQTKKNFDPVCLKNRRGNNYFNMASSSCDTSGASFVSQKGS